MNQFLQFYSKKFIIYSSFSKSRTVQVRKTNIFTMAEAGTKKGEGKVPEKKSELLGNRLFSSQKMTRGATAEQEKERFLKMDLEEKRQNYKCKDKYLLLDDVPSWPSYFKEHKDKLLKYWKGKKRPEMKYNVNEELNQKVSIWRGDITRLEIDAIVNAANNSLMGGGGVDGAIHAAAGSMLKAECCTLNGCDTGDAKITGGYKVPAKYIIHTVGPVGSNDIKLKSCYDTCLSIVQNENLKSVAFPCISTGIYGFPNEKAAPLAIHTAREFLEKHGENVERIIFCLFMPVDVQLYEINMQQIFPTATDDDSEKLKAKETTDDVEKNSLVKDGHQSEGTSPKAKKSNNMKSPPVKTSDPKDATTITETDTVKYSEEIKKNDLAEHKQALKKKENLEVKTDNKESSEIQNIQTDRKDSLEIKNDNIQPAEEVDKSSQASGEKSAEKSEADSDAMDTTLDKPVKVEDNDVAEVHKAHQTMEKDVGEVQNSQQTIDKDVTEVQTSTQTIDKYEVKVPQSHQSMETTEDSVVEGHEKVKISTKL